MIARLFAHGAVLLGAEHSSHGWEALPLPACNHCLREEIRRTGWGVGSSLLVGLLLTLAFSFTFFSSAAGDTWRDVLPRVLRFLDEIAVGGRSALIAAVATVAIAVTVAMGEMSRRIGDLSDRLTAHGGATLSTVRGLTIARITNLALVLVTCYSLAIAGLVTFAMSSLAIAEGADLAGHEDLAITLPLSTVLTAYLAVQMTQGVEAFKRIDFVQDRVEAAVAESVSLRNATLRKKLGGSPLGNGRRVQVWAVWWIVVMCAALPLFFFAADNGGWAVAAFGCVFLLLGGFFLLRAVGRSAVAASPRSRQFTVASGHVVPLGAALVVSSVILAVPGVEEMSVVMCVMLLIGGAGGCVAWSFLLFGLAGKGPMLPVLTPYLLPQRPAPRASLPAEQRRFLGGMSISLVLLILICGALLVHWGGADGAAFDALITSGLFFLLPTVLICWLLSMSWLRRTSWAWWALLTSGTALQGFVLWRLAALVLRVQYGRAPLWVVAVVLVLASAMVGAFLLLTTGFGGRGPLGQMERYFEWRNEVFLRQIREAEGKSDETRRLDGCAHQRGVPHDRALAG